MKRLIVLVALLATCANLNGQSFLKGLGEKAKKAATEKVGSALGGLLGNNAQTNAQTSEQAASESEEQSEYYYAQSLASDCSSGTGYTWEGEDKDLPQLNGSSFKDILGFMPAVPTVSDLLNKEKSIAFDKQARTAENSASAIVTRNIMEYTQQTQALAQQKVPTQSNGQPAAAAPFTPEELMAEFQKKGIDISKASEAQIEDVTLELIARKMGISKAEAKAKLIQSNIEDAASTGKLEKLHEEIMLLNEGNVAGLLAAATSMNLSAISGSTIKAQGLEGALQELGEQIVQGWAKSEECAKINEMELELQSKLDAWMEKENKGNNDAYPSWWKESRIAQNKLVDSYNQKQLEKWVETINKYIKDEKKEVDHLAKLEQELNSLSATDKANPVWLQSMTSLYNLSGKIIVYVAYPRFVMSCPMVGYTSTEEPTV